jgi:hypothetical protein
MKLRFVVAALALASSTLAAHAQVGLYFNPVVSRVSNSVADTGPFAFLGQNTTSRIFGGVDFGGYYEFAHFEKFDVSADLRDVIQHGNSASLNSFLVGVRVSGKPFAHSLKPYGQLSIGAGRTEAQLSPEHISKLEYDIMAGVDRPLNRHVDWRILEIGYGSVTTISSSTHGFAGQATVPAANLLNFSTGFVFRIP